MGRRDISLQNEVNCLVREKQKFGLAWRVTRPARREGDHIASPWWFCTLLKKGHLAAARKRSHQWCLALTPNITETIERMTCHCFLQPIRRDLASSYYTTAKKCNNAWAKYKRTCVTKIYTNSATRTYMYQLVTKLGLRCTDNRFYFTLYSLSVSSVAKSLQLILETRATNRLISYLLADDKLICRLCARCMISNNNINSGSLRQRVCRYFLQNNV